MPEGVQGYPRWNGDLATGPAFPTIAAQEVRRATINPWSQAALVLVLGYTLLVVGQLWSLSREFSPQHTMPEFLAFLNLLPWGTVAVAAVMSGPALLEDARLGALELYMSRAVTRRDYLAGKVLAVFLVTTATLLIPALVYWGATYLFFDAHPEEWARVPLGAFGFALMWGAMITGVGLGLSCVMRSSRAATLTLFAVFAILEAILSNLLEGITRDGTWRIISPFAAIEQQQAWLFTIDAPYAFPEWWGLGVWGGLTIAGWALVAWKHPRLRGDDRGRA